MNQVDLIGKKPLVYIDVHETSGRKGESSVTLFRDYLKREGVFYQVKNLEVGDLILVGDYAIERKTISDFCHSLFGSKHGTPRLMNQMKALKDAYETPILLLEGGLSVMRDPNRGAIFYLKHLKQHQHNDYLYWALNRKINMHPNQFDGALRKIREMGVKIVESFDERDGASKLQDLLSEAQGKEEEEEKERPPTIRQKPKLKTLLDKQIFLLSGLPQVSTVRAKKLLETFGHPFNVIENIEDWGAVKGIGKKTVKRVKKVLFRQEIKQDESSNK